MAGGGRRGGRGRVLGGSGREANGGSPACWSVSLPGRVYMEPAGAAVEDSESLSIPPAIKIRSLAADEVRLFILLRLRLGPLFCIPSLILRPAIRRVLFVWGPCRPL